MGNTTIVELNHDYAFDIRRNPDAFVRQILEQLGSMSRTGQAIHGGTIIVAFHRSESPIYRAWEEFKAKAAATLKETP